jgi:hypothetical protein
VDIEGSSRDKVVAGPPCTADVECSNFLDPRARKILIPCLEMSLWFSGFLRKPFNLVSARHFHHEDLTKPKGKTRFSIQFLIHARFPYSF